MQTNNGTGWKRQIGEIGDLSRGHSGRSRNGYLVERGGGTTTAPAPPERITGTTAQKEKHGTTAGPKIGVFVCHCGSNIAGVVDCGRVRETAEKLPGVVVAKENKYTCSDLGQEEIIKAIRENGVERVVVASCSPRLHEPTFRKCIEQAGLNPYLLQMVNIREQCSWVHSHEKEK
ncbi:MAG: hypothetical protein KJ672_07210, partial [Candidatus Thermoplasmatota archaeon]|nr:hypothetical protein [Candidatus Thermoplasmatota archaeon]